MSIWIRFHCSAGLSRVGSSRRGWKTRMRLGAHPSGPVAERLSHGNVTHARRTGWPAVVKRLSSLGGPKKHTLGPLILIPISLLATDNTDVLHPSTPPKNGKKCLLVKGNITCNSIYHCTKSPWAFAIHSFKIPFFWAVFLWNLTSAIHWGEKKEKNIYIYPTTISLHIF